MNCVHCSRPAINGTDCCNYCARAISLWHSIDGSRDIDLTAAMYSDVASSSLRENTVTTRTSQYCWICQKPYPAGSKMLVQVCRDYKSLSSMYSCLCHKAEAPDSTKTTNKDSKGDNTG